MQLFFGIIQKASSLLETLVAADMKVIVNVAFTVCALCGTKHVEQIEQF